MSQTENENLVTFSDQAIIQAVDHINHFLDINYDNKYDFKSLIYTVDPQLIEGLELILDEQVTLNITEMSSDREISNITDNIYSDISQWNPALITVLGVVLCKKIIENKTIYDGNTNITVQHLKQLFKERYTEDLLYINLASQRDILKYKPQKE